MGSGTDKTRDGVGGLSDLLVALFTPVGDRVGHTVLEVLVEHRQGEGAQGLVDRRGLREDVDAVLVVLDHALKSDRKSTRLNSSHVSISYAVFCLNKKTIVNYAPVTQ